MGQLFVCVCARPSDAAAALQTSGKDFHHAVIVSLVLQEVACVFLVLCALLQLNLLSTRNPNVWWWFNKKQGSGAPPPSLVLVFFMSIFLLAATFVAVYWPSNVRPDGGRGWMEGAGRNSPPPPPPTHTRTLPDHLVLMHGTFMWCSELRAALDLSTITPFLCCSLYNL